MDLSEKDSLLDFFPLFLVHGHMESLLILGLLVFWMILCLSKFELGKMVTGSFYLKC